MNALHALGARIRSDVDALLSGRTFRQPLEPLLEDEELIESSARAAGARRRSDAAAPLLEALEHVGVPQGLPVEGRMTSDFGWRVHPTLRRRRMHEGIDIAAPAGTPVVATAAGTVTFAGGAGAYGNLVKIAHAGGYETRYAHLQSIAVRVGQQVERGAVLGAVGSTGRSTGPHTHYEVREHGEAIDPTPAAARRRNDEDHG